MTLTTARNFVGAHKDKAAASGGIVLAVGMVLTFIESRDAAKQARIESAARADANILLHERLAKLEAAVTFFRGKDWVTECQPAVEVNRAAGITPSRASYEQKSKP
jgi:hypothetical protein